MVFRDYRYACVNRPAGYASVPDGYIKVEGRPNRDDPYYDLARNGFVVYDRPLTSKEMNSYELAKIFTDSDEQALINEILSDDLLEYARGYVEIAMNDFQEFCGIMGSALHYAVKKQGYYMHGIENLDQFYLEILDRLKQVVAK